MFHPARRTMKRAMSSGISDERAVNEFDKRGLYFEAFNQIFNFIFKDILSSPLSKESEIVIISSVTALAED